MCALAGVSCYYAKLLAGCLFVAEPVFTTQTTLTLRRSSCVGRAWWRRSSGAKCVRDILKDCLVPQDL